ncbi:50S ribosomal protein L4 [Labeo rohita]|uniref:50S ribosomal protein L4 n=1 Tax=Labeo rohita TaxID=84645 RepID=A0ABQ8L8X4_LABRO|nr:50S ribosomal protein L4 [Labeo rohita]
MFVPVLPLSSPSKKDLAVDVEDNSARDSDTTEDAVPLQHSQAGVQSTQSSSHEERPVSANPNNDPAVIAGAAEAIQPGVSAEQVHSEPVFEVDIPDQGKQTSSAVTEVNAGNDEPTDQTHVNAASQEVMDSKLQNKDFDKDYEDLCAEDDEMDAVHASEGVLNPGPGDRLSSKVQLQP